MANITKHRRPSVETRNANVIRKVMKEGASKTEVCREYHIQWNSLRDSIRNNHYHLDTKPNARNQKLYEQFCAQAAANEAKAAVSSANSQKSATATATATAKDEPISINATATSAQNISTIYVVEPGYLLHQDFESVLAIDDGKSTFYIPRFCINELIRISESTREENKMTKDTAKSLVRKIYSAGIWGNRIISFKPEEQNFILKTSENETFKNRSFGIAEAAIELYLCGDCNVVVLTNSREVELLLEDFCKKEEIKGISVQRVRTFKPI